VKVQTGAEATNDIFGCFCIVIFCFTKRGCKYKAKGNGINSPFLLFHDQGRFMPEIFCLFICPHATFAKKLLTKQQGKMSALNEVVKHYTPNFKDVINLHH